MNKMSSVNNMKHTFNQNSNISQIKLWKTMKKFSKQLVKNKKCLWIQIKFHLNLLKSSWMVFNHTFPFFFYHITCYFDWTNSYISNWFVPNKLYLHCNLPLIVKYLTNCWRYAFFQFYQIDSMKSCVVPVMLSIDVLMKIRCNKL